MSERNTSCKLLSNVCAGVPSTCVAALKSHKRAKFKILKFKTSERQLEARKHCGRKNWRNGGRNCVGGMAKKREEKKGYDLFYLKY